MAAFNSVKPLEKPGMKVETDWTQLAVITIPQRRSEVLFQIAEMTTDDRVAHGQFARRLSDTAKPPDGLESPHRGEWRERGIGGGSEE